jgi:hypothetical protein
MIAKLVMEHMMKKDNKLEPGLNYMKDMNKSIKCSYFSCKVVMKGQYQNGKKYGLWNIYEN